MTSRLVPVAAHTRRSPSKPHAYVETHARLRAYVETQREEARVEAELSDEAVIAELAEMLLDARVA